MISCFLYLQAQAALPPPAPLLHLPQVVLLPLALLPPLELRLKKMRTMIFCFLFLQAQVALPPLAPLLLPQVVLLPLVLLPLLELRRKKRMTMTFCFLFLQALQAESPLVPIPHLAQVEPRLKKRMTMTFCYLFLQVQDLVWTLVALAAEFPLAPESHLFQIFSRLTKRRTQMISFRLQYLAEQAQSPHAVFTAYLESQHLTHHDFLYFHSNPFIYDLREDLKHGVCGPRRMDLGALTDRSQSSPFPYIRIFECVLSV